MIYAMQPRDAQEFSPIIKTGHFRLTSGGHSDMYVNKDAISTFPKLFNLIITRFSAAAQMISGSFDVIVSPAVAGIPFGSPLAFHRKVPFIYPEKKGEKMVFRQVLKEYLRGKRVLVVEDIVTTGSSILKTADAIIDAGGDYIGSFCIWDRSAEELDPVLNLLYYIHKQRIAVHQPFQCPICRMGIPLTDPKTNEILIKV